MPGSDCGRIVHRMIDLTGKTAFLTGGTRGIGAETVRLFARLGARVGFCYRSAEGAARDLERELGASVRGWSADVADGDQIERTVGRVVERWGNLDIVVANAAIWKGAPIDEMSMDEWREVIDVNLTGTYNACRFGVPELKRSGGGSIVVVSSTAGQRGEAGHSHYAATKGAQISLVKSLAIELAPRIRVNGVAPGWVDTEMNIGPFAGGGRAAIERGIPLGRVATSKDIAASIAFLASEDAGHITGEILNVNGGSVLCG